MMAVGCGRKSKMAGSVVEVRDLLF